MDMFRMLLARIAEILFPPSREELLLTALSLETLLTARAPAHAEPYFFAPLSYHNQYVKALIWTLKYRGRRASAALLAEALSDVLLEELAEREAWNDFTKPLLIPMPIGKRRRRERGFNQCELLAEELMKRLPLAYAPDILVKIKETPPQTKLARRRDREKNLRDAFHVPNPALVAGRNIILLDDVITTGSTMREARRMLKQSGARSVWCVASAH